MTKIIGIDPGLSKAGWGLIDVRSNNYILLDSGVIKTKSSDHISKRLADLCNNLEEVILKHKPTEAAIEHTFVNKNSKSTLLLATARGALISVPARLNLAVEEYSANMIKKAVVGFGHATKEQVIYMVKTILNTPNDITNDAADALAAAICCANNNKFLQTTAYAKK